MARSKAPKYIRDRRTRPQQQQTTSTGLWWKLPSKIAGAVLAAIGFAAAVVTFLPKVALDVSGSLRPQEPTGTVFYLSNGGVLPIYDIVATCITKDLKDTDGNEISDMSFQENDSKAEALSPGQKMTLPCSKSVTTAGRNIVRAEMAVEVEYRPPLTWWHKKDRFDLMADRATDGTWIWKNIPH